MSEVLEYQVVGMTCGHCEQAVAGEISKIPGVTGATADASTGIVTVEATEPPDRADVAAAVDEAGYELA
jgi:copper chaperone CopZ